MIQYPDFSNKEDLFKWLKTNKHLLITEKKSQLKCADSVHFSSFEIENGLISKSVAKPELMDLSEFPVKVVINTTNIRDSHKDVHIPGLWKKSISEQKLIYLLQEHEMKFDHIISDRVTSFTKTFSWAELGYNWPGQTEALIFDATIVKDRNPYMAEQYAKGYVKNHSVGMQYVKLELAMNSDSKYDEQERKVWDKYIEQIVNRSEVEQDGYFWAVTEAKLIEGSAVPLGSNFVTPTLQAGKSLEVSRETTDDEPKETGIDKIINHINNFKL